MLNRLTCLGAALLVAAVSGAVQAQFSKTITDFEGTFPGGVFTAEIIFEDPGLSGTTRGLDAVVGNDSYLSNINSAPSPFTEVSSGVQSYAVFWGWEDPNDHSSWVRLVTTNTQSIPNPALHLGGKVRMYMGARCFTNDSFVTEVPNASVYLTLGIRETGAGVPQGGNGGTSGDIEWVNINQKLVEIVAGTNGICDSTADPLTDDVQLVPPGSPAPSNGACIDGGTNGIINSTRDGDDVTTSTPIGDTLIVADGVMRPYEFDLPALETAGKIAAFTGNASLGATPNNRGVLEHLAIVNNPANGPINGKVWLFFIDDVVFEAPLIDPPVITTVPEQPRPLDEEVLVEQVDPAADLVEIIQLPDTVLGSVDPAGATSVSVPISPLPANVEIVARQTVGANMSDNSSAVRVVSAGNAPLRIAIALRESDLYDNALGCGADGTGFDPDRPGATLEFVGATGTQPQFGVPNGRRFEPQPDWFEITFDPCVDGVSIFSGNGELDINSTGLTKAVWEGLYFRIDSLNPSDGPYTIYLDDLVVRNADGPGMDCVIDDFESYTIDEFIIEGTAGTADSVAEGDDIQVVSPGSTTFAGQIIISGGPNRIIDTTPAPGEGRRARHARFNYPGVAGGSVNLAPSPDLSAVTDAEAFSGTQSLVLNWAFASAVNPNSTARVSSNGPASAVVNPPEAMLNPDPVVPITYAACDDGVDLVFSMMVKLPLPPVPADCDGDGDVDLVDYGCYQRCHGASPVPPECEKVSLAPNGAPDDTIDLADFELFSILLSGPQ